MEQNLPLDLQRIESGIQSNPQIRKIVQKVFLFDRVDSTNQRALQMSGLSDRVLILAEAQDHGRGRQNRTWVSPHGVNLYLSLLLCPDSPMRAFPLFSLASAVALVSAIQSATGLQSALKWPNDVLLNDKKVAGILLESGQGAYLVIGIGVNVNWENQDIPQTLAATSLKMALGHVVDRSEFVLHLLAALSAQFTLLDAGKKGQLIETVSNLCIHLGKRVRVQAPDKTYEGVAEQILEDGGLLLRLGDGTSRKMWLGDLIQMH